MCISKKQNEGRENNYEIFILFLPNSNSAKKKEKNYVNKLLSNGLFT